MMNNIVITIEVASSVWIGLGLTIASLFATIALWFLIGDWISGHVEEWYRTKVLKQPPYSQRVKRD